MLLTTQRAKRLFAQHQIRSRKIATSLSITHNSTLSFSRTIWFVWRKSAVQFWGLLQSMANAPPLQRLYLAKVDNCSSKNDAKSPLKKTMFELFSFNTMNLRRTKLRWSSIWKFNRIHQIGVLYYITESVLGGNNRSKKVIILLAVIFGCLYPIPSFAYVGPAIAAGSLVTMIAVVLFFLLSLFLLIFIGYRLFFTKDKSKT